MVKTAQCSGQNGMRNHKKHWYAQTRAVGKVLPSEKGRGRALVGNSAAEE